MSHAQPALRLLAAALLLAACASTPKRDAQPTPRPVTTSGDAGLADMTPAPGADVASLDDLAKQGEPLLMHEVKRAADVSVPVAVDASTDTCFRAAVGANHGVRAWFEDANHAIRGEVAERSAGPADASASLMVPPRGPVCAKKGEQLRLVVMAPNAGTIARAVVFASP